MKSEDPLSLDFSVNKSRAMIKSENSADIQSLDTSRSEKRKHVTLTLFEKIDIIEACEKKEMTKAAIASHYGIGRSTVTDIYNNRDQIRLFVEHHGSEEVVSKRRKLDKFYLSSAKIDADESATMMKVENDESMLVEGIEEFEYQEIEDQDYEVVYENSLPVFSHDTTPSGLKKLIRSENKSVLSTTSSSANKRRSKTLTFKEKFEIIEQVEAGVAVQLIAQSYDVGKTTIYDFLKRKEEIKAYIQKTQDFERRTFKGSRFPTIEESAIEWCSSHATFTKDELLTYVSQVYETAKEAGQAVPKNGLSKASWWKRFFRRNPQFKSRVYVEDGEPEEFPADSSLNDSEEKPRIISFSEKLSILSLIDKGKDIDEIAEQFHIKREDVEDIASRRELLKNVRAAAPKNTSDKRRFAKPPSGTAMMIENELLAWCLKQESYPIDNGQIIAKAEAIHDTFEEKDPEFTPNSTWVKRFIMRNPSLRRKQGVVVYQNEMYSSDQLIEEDTNLDDTDNNSQYEYLEESEIVEHDPDNAEYLEEYIVEEIEMDPLQSTNSAGVNYIEVTDEQPTVTRQTGSLGVSPALAQKSLRILLKYAEQNSHDFILPHLRDYQDQLDIINCSL